MIYSLSDKEYENVGGKAQKLMQLSALYTIPQGFVITADDKLNSETILRHFDNINTTFAAVRSSAVNEDGTSASWAGQLETFLNVSRGNVLDAIEKCRLSAQSDRAKAYSSKQGISGKVAVIVQAMVNSRVSGVAFSDHPVTSAETPVIEATIGLGDALVGGEITPDTYVVAGNNVQEYHASIEPILSGSEIKEVADLVRQVKAELHYPVDIEWAYDGSVLFLLQARPITALNGGKQ